MTSRIQVLIAKIILISCIFFSLFFALWNRWWSDGDELHYLVMTQSILLDRDLDLDNNYNNKDYYVHHELDSDRHGEFGFDGSYRSHHQPLLSLIVAPGFEARQALGARLIVWILHLFGLATLWYFLKDLGFSIRTRLTSLALFAVQLPIIAYSQYVYTDLPSGYFVLWIIYSLFKYQQTRQVCWIWISSIVYALAVWLHIKLILFSAPIYLVYGIYLINTESPTNPLSKIKKFSLKRYHEVAAVITPFLLGIVSISWVMWRWTGIFRPDAVHKLVVERASHFDSFFSYNPTTWINNLYGLFLDSESGLFYNAPLFLLVILGMMILWRKHRKAFWVVATGFGLILFRQLTFIKWRTCGDLPQGI